MKNKTLFIPVLMISRRGNKLEFLGEFQILDMKLNKIFFLSLISLMNTIRSK